MVAGDRGVGKTFFALSMAYAIAKGDDFLGFPVPKPRKVLYVDGGTAPYELQQRLRSIEGAAEREGIGEPNFALSNLSLLLDADQEPEAPDLADPDGPGRDCMTDALGDSEVLVLDHLPGLYRNGNQSDPPGNWDVMQWLLGFRRRRKAVLIVHDADDTNRPVLDTIIRLWRPKPGCLVNAEFTKARLCIGLKPFAMRMQFEDGYFRLHREGTTSRKGRPDRIRLLD